MSYMTMYSTCMYYSLFVKQDNLCKFASLTRWYAFEKSADNVYRYHINMFILSALLTHCNSYTYSRNALIVSSM